MEDKLIIIKRFNNPVDANIAKGLLESNNIDCTLHDENTTYANPVNIAALGGVKLLVKEEDYEKALKIFEEAREST